MGILHWTWVNYARLPAGSEDALSPPVIAADAFLPMSTTAFPFEAMRGTSRAKVENSPGLETKKNPGAIPDQRRG